MKKLLVVFYGILFCGSAFAHDYWLKLDNYFPQPNSEITVSVCYGHQFPTDGVGSATGIAKMFVLEPDGVVRPITVLGEGEKKTVAPIKVRVTKTGTHYIVLVKNAGFVTHTTKGYERKPKNEAEGSVLESSWSEGCMIAVVTVGKASGQMPKSVFANARFRMQPLIDLGNLHVGDTVPVQLFLDEKPFRSWLYATYDGFSEERDTYAYATRMPSDMTGKVKIIHPGLWILLAKDDQPYPDTTKADKFTFGCNVTFMVR